MGGEWVYDHLYYDPHYDKSAEKTILDNPVPNFEDYYPNISAYYNYLSKLGFSLNETAYNFAQDSYKHLCE